MDVTKVMAYFCLVGDHFPLEEITEVLTIEPTETYTKGDIIEKNRATTFSPEVRKRVETDWTLSTGYQESYDINDQLKSLLNFLEGKQKDIIRLKKKYELTSIFIIVIEIENNQTPAMCLEKEIIDYASTIGAEIHFDLYVM